MVLVVGRRPSGSDVKIAYDSHSLAGEGGLGAVAAAYCSATDTMNSGRQQKTEPLLVRGIRRAIPRLGM